MSQPASYNQPVRSWAVRDNAAAAIAVAAADRVVDADEPRHTRDWQSDFDQRYDAGIARARCHCSCGRSFASSQGRGLHIAAAERRRDQLWVVSYDVAFREAKHLPCTCANGHQLAVECPNCSANLQLRAAGKPHAYAEAGLLRLRAGA